MVNITAAMVKALRDQTGAGMMDCKKALTEADGDTEKAIDLMRKSGALKAAKKSGRIAAEGTIAVARSEREAVLVEFNSETDFAARNQEFTGFADRVAMLALSSGARSIEELRDLELDGQTVGEALTALIAKIGENLSLRRLDRLSGEVLGTYIHSNRRIGVMVSLHGGSEDVARDVAMHVCAARPDFVHPEDVSAEVVEKERRLQIEIAMQSGKSESIAEKMVAGRMKKFTGEVSLTGQPFVKDPSQTVGQMLGQHHADAVAFVRYEVGEGLERRQEDFAAEVRAQLAAAKA